MSDAFDKAYADWLQSHDPATEQFRPDTETWAASHDDPIPRQVERVGLTARLVYFLLFGVVRPVCEVFAWAEAKLGGKR